jgi:L-2-hydroxyglutarate oxidase LhgO
MGSSIAYHLSAMTQSLKIAVIEKDPAYIHASAMLSVIIFVFVDYEMIFL